MIPGHGKLIFHSQLFLLKEEVPVCSCINFFLLFVFIVGSLGVYQADLVWQRFFLIDDFWVRVLLFLACHQFVSQSDKLKSFNHLVHSGRETHLIDAVVNGEVNTECILRLIVLVCLQEQRG